MQTTYVRQTSASRSQFNEQGPGHTRSTQTGSSQTRPQTPAKTRSTGNGQSQGDRALIEALVNSKIFQEYERAFNDATGLPVALRPVETWQLPHHGKRNEGPFCSLISQKSRACASCLSVQETLSGLAAEQAHTLGCPNGLCDTAVPVRLGDRLIGFLQTGQMFRKKPTPRQFEHAAKQVASWGVDVDMETLRQAYFSTRVVPAKQHEAVV